MYAACCADKVNQHDQAHCYTILQKQYLGHDLFLDSMQLLMSQKKTSLENLVTIIRYKSDMILSTWLDVQHGISLFLCGKVVVVVFFRTHNISISHIVITQQFFDSPIFQFISYHSNVHWLLTFFNYNSTGLYNQDQFWEIQDPRRLTFWTQKWSF